MGKKKVPENPMQDQNQSPAKFSLVNFSPIKGWFDYGANRTMSGLKLANAADIKAAEMDRDAKKQGRDWNQIVMIVAVMAIIGAISFMLIMQFGNINEISNELAGCRGTRAEAQGKLSVCQEQLDFLQPEAREIKPELNI